MKNLLSLLLALIIFCAAPRAWADGVTDFIIDPAVGHTISAPGSYRLAKNVAMTNNSATALTISSNDVTVDLNGHTISGNEFGASNALNLGASEAVKIRGGGIALFAGAGLTGTGADCVAEGLTVRSCSQGIALTGASAHVSHCKVRKASGYGIDVGTDSVIEDCEASGANRGGTKAGIHGGVGSTIRSCVASGNGPVGVFNGQGVGIWVEDGATVEDCKASGNYGLGDGRAYGIHAEKNCTIAHNTCLTHVAGPGANIAAGILANDSCRIVGNVCSGNLEGSAVTGYGVGIYVYGYSLVEGNTCDRNGVSGSNGSGWGIAVVGRATTVRGNNVTNNTAAGSGSSVGIDISGNGYGCLIEGNNCADNSGGFTSYGMLSDALTVVFRGNTTSGHDSAGIRLNSAPGNGYTCRLERNRSSETTAISGGAGHSLGTGEDANIAY